MVDLARVLDPAELDRADGPRGRMTLDVPAAWLDAGDTVELVVPPRLVCGRCEGGGCDGCARSGAVRLSLDEPARTFRVALPRGVGTPVLVRVARPLGGDAGLEQLSLEIRAARVPTVGCRRVPAAFAARSVGARSVALGAALLLSVAAALAAAWGR